MMSGGFWRDAQPLLLASGSATRRAMLLAAGIPVEVRAATIDERAVEEPLRLQGVIGPPIAAALACAKALAVSQSHPGRFVLGADQVLVCEGESFHKPENPTAARAQIESLSGRTHELYSAFVIARDGEIMADGLGSARLTMRALSSDFASAYVAQAGDDVTGSVGGYQIEGLGAQLFEAIEGDHFTILGLPLLAVLAALRDLDRLAR